MILLIVITGIAVGDKMPRTVLSGYLTFVIVIGSVFVPGSNGMYLLGTLPGSPVIYGIVYFVLWLVNKCLAKGLNTSAADMHSVQRRLDAWNAGLKWGRNSKAD